METKDFYPSSRRNNLPKGEFLLRVLGPEHVYDSYVLRVAEHATSEGTRLVCRKFILDQKTGLPGETVHSYVLGIKPLYSTVETRTRQGILQDVLSLLKNPLVLISAVSLGITLVLPMLQESLDAEAMEDITGSVPGGKWFSCLRLRRTQQNFVAFVSDLNPGNYASGFLTKIS